MTASENILANINELRAQCDAAEKKVLENTELFNQFSKNSSFGYCGAPRFYLHDHQGDVKAFCRAFGGQWTREESGYSIQYTCEGFSPVWIFNAEPKPLPQPLEL